MSIKCDLRRKNKTSFIKKNHLSIISLSRLFLLISGRLLRQVTDIHVFPAVPYYKRTMPPKVKTHAKSYGGLLFACIASNCILKM